MCNQRLFPCRWHICCELLHDAQNQLHNRANLIGRGRHLVDAWWQQLHDGEVLARALHWLPCRPVVKRPLHFHMAAPMAPYTSASSLTGAFGRIGCSHSAGGCSR
jgi:hypothetical protein